MRSLVIVVTIIASSLLYGQVASAAEMTFRYPYPSEDIYSVSQGPANTQNCNLPPLERPSHCTNPNKEAWDFTPVNGTKVAAAADGVVVVVVDGYEVGGTCDVSLRNKANLIVIRHTDGAGRKSTTIYVHHKFQTAEVKVGQSVASGQVIATVGNTGFTCGASPDRAARGTHIHFALQADLTPTEIRAGLYTKDSIPVSFAGPQLGPAFATGSSCGTPVNPFVAPYSPPVYDLGGRFAVKFVSRLESGSISYAPRNAIPYAFRVQGVDLTTLPLEWKLNRLIIWPLNVACGWASTAAYNFVFLMQPAAMAQLYELGLELPDGRRAFAHFNHR